MMNIQSRMAVPVIKPQPWLADDHRRALILLCLVVAMAASVTYDTLTIIPYGLARAALAAVVLLSLVTAFFLQRYPRDVIQSIVVANWPLHLFTLSFFASVFVVHRRANADQLLAYTVVAYATYMFVPFLLVLDRWLFESFLKLMTGLSAVLAIPSLVGALGIEALGPIRLSNKPSYSEFSGIIASGGIFEYAEGHALQMAVGLFCCLYAVRKWRRWSAAACLLLTAMGLIVSQGRGAILGVLIAVAFMCLPELFRRSRPLFLGTVLGMWLFPFFILPQLANIPGVAGYLRLERGLSGRDVAWRFAYSVIKEQPVKGQGFLASGDLTERHQRQLERTGYSGTGTTFHNTFITKAVELGVIATLLYLPLYLVPLIRICAPTEYGEEQQLVRNVLLVAITASVFRDYNIGGVRSTSVLISIFLGLANLWPWLTLWKRPVWSRNR